MSKPKDKEKKKNKADDKKPFTEHGFMKSLEKVVSTPKKTVDDKLKAERKAKKKRKKKKRRGAGN